MSDDADRIRQQMRNLRQDLGAEVKDIVQGAKQLADWRYYVRHYPWTCIGGAFALGLLAIPGRKKPADAEMQKLIDQLKRHGLTAATAATPLTTGGIAGKLLAVAGPILLRNVTHLIAQQLRPSDAGSAGQSPHDASQRL